MKPSALDSFREQLLTMGQRVASDRSQIESEALKSSGGEASGISSNLPHHLSDVANHEFEQEVSLGLLENEGQLLQDINDALHRIETGEFGICETCKTEIPQERLKALPFARYCMNCAAQAEAANER